MGRKTSKTRPLDVGDPSVVAGGSRTPKAMRRRTRPIGDMPSDELGKHIARLLALHPDIGVRFRRHKLSDLSVAAKQAMLEDIHAALGIT